MIGPVVSHYEILEQLGQGGMGVVYKARDTQLDRFVALKFLSSHLSDDPTAKVRFVQEAKAASALDSPSICAIHEIGETDEGRLYIVMPFYDGNTLKYRMEGRPMPIEQVIDITTQIGRGLERAHEAGIVHRDIKPANIMVTNRNEVKILDFGIAKLEHGANITQTGSTLGTVAYMSPEQSGGGKTDLRSDLWAVGILMYEMLTGSRPFTGEYDQAVVYAIINEDPEPVQEVNPDVPASLGTIVSKLLSKNPSNRFQTAGELLTALSGITETVARGDEPPRARPAFTLGKTVWYGVAVFFIAAIGFLILQSSAEETAVITDGPHVNEEQDHATLAVLPFSNLRRDPKTDFLGFALADQVIGSLAYVKELSVRPASSVRQYQDGDYDVQEAGVSLGADYVMAGNYLQQGDQMRLTVELVDVNTREMVWREPIDLRYSDVFELQDIVAERLLQRLEVQFSDEERSRMRADVSADPVAYEYYLRALSHQEDRDGNRLAIELLEQATTLDSTFAPAWNELGSRLRIQSYWNLGGEKVFRRSKVCYEKAVELNPDLLSALSNIAQFYTDAGELDRAYEAAERVFEINQNNPEGHFARGYVFRYAGLIDESAAEMHRALAADSTNPKFRSASWTFITMKDYDAMRKALRLSRVPGLAEAWDGEILRRQGRPEEARKLLEHAVREDPNGIAGLWAKGVLSGMIGAYDKGLEAARKWEQANVVDGEGLYFLGAIYCFNGAAEKCLETLGKSVKAGYYNYTMFEGDPFLDGVRGKPEFRELVRRVRERSEAFRRRHPSVERGV